MAKKTVFQRLTDVVIGSDQSTSRGKSITTYNLPSDNILYKTSSKEDAESKLRQLKQQRYLSYQWAKTGYDTSMEQMAGQNQVKVMYRDADLMDGWPEIGTALDIYAEEACTRNKEGKIINVTSKSKRIKSVLEDLFYNRLDINTMGEMIIRSTCKYGNEFMLLNVDSENGVLGWRELPVYEIKRVENGIQGIFSGGYAFNATKDNLKPDEVRFIWEGHNEQTPFLGWQIAHFRLIKDSLLLPYGVSVLNKARRHWRMLSMMEDAMLLYRLEKSIERRIYKVNVGLIDDEDVPAFLQDFMNNVKRAPIIDPQTGQIDLRKNFLDVSADYIIPVRPGQDPTSIDVLQSNQSQTAMDDIEYMENKVLSALRVPKTFLNFKDAEGKGQNLSLIDIRFNRMVNSVQQSILLELTKVAIIHLYLLGFTDDLTNFNLTMNNPSNQIEMMELDNTAKRIGNANSALGETGVGIPIMSWHQAQRDIMGKTDEEISDMLNEIRLEKAIANELELTSQIIKKTDLFKKVDRIYGEPGAEYSQQPSGNDQDPMGGGGGLMGGGGFGDDLGNLGEPGADDLGDISGEEGGEPLGGMDAENENTHVLNGREVLLERLLSEYREVIMKKHNKNNDAESMDDKIKSMNENLKSTLNEIGKIKRTDIL